MYCIHCGKMIDDNSVFCEYCGGKQSSTRMMNPQQNPQNSGYLTQNPQTPQNSGYLTQNPQTPQNSGYPMQNRQMPQGYMYPNQPQGYPGQMAGAKKSSAGFIAFVVIMLILIVLEILLFLAPGFLTKKHREDKIREALYSSSVPYDPGTAETGEVDT